MATPESTTFLARWQRSRIESPGPSLEQSQQRLFERVASATAKVADLKANLGAAEQQIADLQAKMEANRGPVIVMGAMAVALVILSLWSVHTHHELARLRVAGDASDLLIAKLRDELVSARKTIAVARETIPPETSSWIREQMDAALGSTADADKAAALAQAPKAAAVPPPDPEPTGPSDQRVPGRPQDVEDVVAAPRIEEILTAAEVLSGPAMLESAALDNISSDDLLLAPDHHIGHQVMVTGSVMWLLRRYWLQSDSGHLRMLIDVERLQSDERKALREVVAQIESLVQVRARITGTIERHGTKGYRLAATQLVLVE